MEDKENEQRISQHDVYEEKLPGHIPAQVPSTLFPTVLRRLRLAPEQTIVELSLDDVAAELKSDDWQVRVAAVRSLEKQNFALSRQLLLFALNDEDGSVRAAAVHVLGSGGLQVPLHPLMAALHDNDWHVRETAVFTLGKQGRRVPQKVFTIALSDVDEAVREAAKIVLQQRALEEKTSDSFGLLWEQNIMQNEKEVISLSNGKEENPSSEAIETMPYYGGNGVGPYNEVATENAERSHVTREQEQVSVPREHGSEKSGQWEKVTSFSPRRGSRKVWWGVTAAVAVLCFLLGSVTMSVLPSPMQIVKKFSGGDQQSVPINAVASVFTDPKYSFIAQDDIASVLHLSVAQIQSQLKEKGSLTTMAEAQGISSADMQNIELNAFVHLLNAAVKSGDIQQQDADQLIKQLQSDPQVLEKIAVSVFEVNANQPVPTPPPVSTPASGN